MCKRSPIAPFSVTSCYLKWQSIHTHTHFLRLVLPNKMPIHLLLPATSSNSGLILAKAIITASSVRTVLDP